MCENMQVKRGPLNKKIFINPILKIGIFILHNILKFHILIKLC